MTANTNKMTCDVTGKPTTARYLGLIDDVVMTFAGVEKERKAQISYRVNRKFLWLWVYEKTADGTLYLNVTLDHRVDDPHIHKTTQVSTNRWNHHVEVKSEETATSDWLRDLIRQGYDFARG